MEAKLSEYVAYFKNLAAKHKLIADTAAEKHFYRMELEEVLTNIKSNLNFPAFALEAYDANFNDSVSDNVLKSRAGAFMILDHPEDKKDMDQIHTVWDACEAIADDIVIKMWNDKRGNQEKVVRGFNLNTIEYKFLANEPGGLYGIRVTFQINSAINNEIDATKWNE